MFKIFYEDLKIGETEEFGSYLVTREEVIDFASKYDPQPFHLDEELAKNSVFGDLCASGWHTGAMMMRMIVDRSIGTGFASMGSPGLDTVEWRKPVFPGDTLSLRGKIIEMRESQSRPNLGLLKSEYEVLNQDGVIVMRVIANSMMLKRPT